MTRRVMGIPIRATELLILDRMELNVHASQICTKANREPSALPIRESKVTVEGPTSTNRERQLVTPSMVSLLIAQRQSANVDTDGYGDGHDPTCERTVAQTTFTHKGQQLLVQINILRRRYSQSRHLGLSPRSRPK